MGLEDRSRLSWPENDSRNGSETGRAARLRTGGIGVCDPPRQVCSRRRVAITVERLAIQAQQCLFGRTYETAEGRLAAFGSSGDAARAKEPASSSTIGAHCIPPVWPPRRRSRLLVYPHTGQRRISACADTIWRTSSCLGVWDHKRSRYMLDLPDLGACPRRLPSLSAERHHYRRKFDLERNGTHSALARFVFRLDKQLDDERTRLTISGNVSAECIDLLETCCEQAIRDGKPVDLILRDVTTIDETGHALLRRLAAQGVCLYATGVYHSYLVEAIRRTVSAAGLNPSEFEL